jgi:DNA (cytosine-5)-methyltransferase 1
VLQLFFSDHCNCGDDPLHTRDIEGTVSAVFHPNEDEMETAEFFVRQTYRTEDPAFLTLTKSELELGRCPCAREKELPEGSFEEVRKDYAVGDAVLYSRPKHDLLEPGIIVEFNKREELVHVRSLKRRDSCEAGAAPNELYFTHKVEAMKPGNIKRHCFVRQFGVNQEIEAPYNRGGIGDCFFIRHEINDEETLVRPLTCKLKGDELRQGFRVGDMEAQKPIMRGMDLFCGGGNFGRGIEEGGAVEMKWAVDFDSGPLHTYRANMKSLDETTLYLGSINNYLADAIRGKYSGERGIPNREEVDFISAGSPCQGFSNANSNHKNSEGSLRKQSLVCSLATAIDLYRPKYAVLENVREIATNRKDKDGNELNTYCTMLTSIVGLGYQVQSFISDAWSYGNCQSRTRLILCISKAGKHPPASLTLFLILIHTLSLTHSISLYLPPLLSSLPPLPSSFPANDASSGLKPLARPPRSHAHNPKHVKSLKLYTAPNGQSFGQRETDGLTPFPFMSVHRGWSRLPYIGDGHISINVRYPDHVTGALSQDTTARLLMSTIPRFGTMNSWYEAIKTGRLHKEIQMYETRGEKDNYFCKTFSRIRSDGLCRTITTVMTPQCTRTGRWLHSDQNRLITVQEARIAQGFPDDEVLVGPLNKRLHVVGNSVARGASMAIGIALRKAYFGNLEE